MLTVTINDTNLEKYIIEKTQISVLPDITNELYYQKLNAQSYGYYINTPVDEDGNDDDDVQPFSQVENTETFTEILRKNAWRKQ